MKKSILVILAATLIFALTGCGGGGSTPTAVTTPTTPTTPTDGVVTNPDGSTTTTVVSPDGTAVATTIDKNGTATSVATTAIDGTVTTVVPQLTMKINSAILVDYDAVTAGVYHTSNPGTLKINYDVSYTTDNIYEDIRYHVVLSNSTSYTSLSGTYGEGSPTAQTLASGLISSNEGAYLTSGINKTGSIITGNYISYVMIQAIPYGEIDYTKPTYLIVTLYAIDSSIPFVFGVASTYVSSQVAIPITILP